MLPTPPPRIRTLLAATTVALCSGTNYVFSAYAPQLASRCGLSSTQLNLVGIAGNLGVYTSGPVWGVFIDRGGPRGVLCWAAVLIALGYGGIRAVYIHASATANNASTKPLKASTQTVALLCFCMLATGFAASAGLNASLNTVARSFPAHQRATASGITLAGFGLSAFLFSTLAHAVFPGRTEGFLALLAVGTAVGMCVGVVGVRTVPVEEEDEDEAEEGYVRVDQEEGGYADFDTPAGGPEPSVRTSLEADYLAHPHHRSHTHLQLHEEVPLTVSRSRSTDVLRSSVDLVPARLRPSLEHLHSSSDEALLEAPPASNGAEKQFGGVADGQVSGKQLFVSPDFWVIVSILTLLSGTGLMYINNVGSVVLALANAPSAANGGVNPLKIAKVQATQVSVVSIWNCLGRIIMGLVSDYAKTRYRINRVWFIPTIALLFLASQLSAQMTTDMYALSRVSGLLGTAYGMLFALLPIIVLEWFGLSNFSMNWGIVSLAPGLGGNVANLIFGKVYDSNVSSVETTARLLRRALRLFVRGGTIPDPSDHTHDCLLGSGCYASAFRVTTAWCGMALVLGLFVALRHERKSRAEGRKGLPKRKWSTVGVSEEGQ